MLYKYLMIEVCLYKFRNTETNASLELTIEIFHDKVRDKYIFRSFASDLYRMKAFIDIDNDHLADEEILVKDTNFDMDIIFDNKLALYNYIEGRLSEIAGERFETSSDSSL